MRTIPLQFGGLVRVPSFLNVIRELFDTHIVDRRGRRLGRLDGLRLPLSDNRRRRWLWWIPRDLDESAPEGSRRRSDRPHTVDGGQVGRRIEEIRAQQHGASYE